MDKMDGRSLDILEENIEKMKQLFPEVFTEGKVDVEKLGQVLGEYAEDEDERYDFTWNGKKDAIRISQTPTTGTLRPDKENSKNWDETENLYIEGDNLEVLKLLQKSYHSKVKMIYIDPPYNTGKDFVYKDNYRDNMKNYLEYTGQVDSEGNKTSTNAESSGRYHTDWLNMMYPRLRLARNLLTDDGVIFISIDDNEVHNLRKVCDEIFGEENFFASLIWKRRVSSAMADNNVSTDHEYVLCFKKKKLEGFLGNKKSDSKYTNPDNDPRGPWIADNLTVGMTASMRPNQAYDLVDHKTGNIYPYNPNRVWAFIPESMEKMIQEGRILFPKDTSKRPMQKRFFNELKSKRNPFSSIMFDKVGLNTEATRIIQDILDGRVFEYSKPLTLLKVLINQIVFKEDIVLDFFAGASTTAHAVMYLNAKDSGDRKFIMVQLPEETDKKSEAFKVGYKTISDIGRERIDRAGEKIKENNKDKEEIEDLDIGFKSFKLDSSNIKEWNPKYEDKDFDFESLVNNFVEGRNEEDILYEIILKYGIDLTVPMKEHNIDGKTIYDIGFGSLYICLDNNIDESIIEKIVELSKESGMERSRVVFKDTGFRDDETKLNAKLTLENNGIEEVLSI